MFQTASFENTYLLHFYKFYCGSSFMCLHSMHNICVHSWGGGGGCYCEKGMGVRLTVI